MRLAIDGRELVGQATGVGRYLDRILTEWAMTGVAPRHRIQLYLPELPSGDLQARLAPLRPEYIVVPGGRGTAWEQVRLAARVRADRPDVLFAPAYTAPVLAGCPVVLTIHDLSYLAHPEWFRPRERWRRALLTRLSARTARHILTDSAFSASEVERLLGVPAERVTVVPLGLGLPAEPVGAGPREPLVLYVGTILNRRRVPDLIRAFARAATIRADLRLVLVGDNRTWPAQDLDAAAREATVSARVEIRSFLPDEALAALYRRASVFVFLSEYEGFGLTPLEALAHGVPAVVLDTPVAREVYGGAARFVAAGDIAGTADAILGLVGDDEARRALLGEASRLLPRYTWATAAARTIGVLERAGG
jgi:glycosyltransferase involved in cell wall biosynthesis